MDELKQNMDKTLGDIGSLLKKIKKNEKNMKNIDKALEKIDDNEVFILDRAFIKSIGFTQEQFEKILKDNFTNGKDYVMC